MTSNPRRWGFALYGTGTIELSAAALEKALDAAGMTSRRKIGENGIEIIATQEAPWYTIVTRCLPQHTIWLLRQSGENQEIFGDFYSFLWHRAIVFVLSLLLAAGITVLWRATIGELNLTLGAATFSYMALATMFALVAIAYLSVGGAHHKEDVWLTLSLEVERAGGSLEKRSSAIILRSVFAYTVMLAFAFSFGVWMIQSLAEERDVTGFVLSALVIVLLLLVITGLAARIDEFTCRIDAIVTGLVTLVAALLYFLPTFMWLAAGNPMALVSKWSSGQAALHPAQAWQLLFVVYAPLVAAFAFLVFLGVLKSPYLARNLARFQKEWRQGLGSPNLGRLRLAVAVPWALMAILIFGAFLTLILCAIQAVDPSFPYPNIGLIELSSAVVNLAFEGLIDRALQAGFTRLAWIVYAATGVALYGVSLGQLYLARRNDRRTAHGLFAHSKADERELEASIILERLACRAGLVDVKLAVAPGSWPSASSQCFLRLGKQERFVIVTQGALLDFDAPVLEALLARELVHLREGHCRKLNLLRWLGRLTFVGDGFVLALQDSFGYEKEADRLMLEEGWTTPESLEILLEMSWNMRLGWQSPRILDYATDEGRLFAGEEPPLPFRRRWRLSQRWRLSWYLFREQYFTASRLHYWHPTFRERLEDLRSRHTPFR